MKPGMRNHFLPGVALVAVTLPATYATLELVADANETRCGVQQCVDNPHHDQALEQHPPEPAAPPDLVPGEPLPVGQQVFDMPARPRPPVRDTMMVRPVPLMMALDNLEPLAAA